MNERSDSPLLLTIQVIRKHVPVLYKKQLRLKESRKTFVASRIQI